MRFKLILISVIAMIASGCQNKYYTEEDFLSILKIDSHIHIGSSDGVFEEQAAADNFILITLNVDHGDSANIRNQFNYAVASVQKHPGKVFFGPTFLFDTAGWGTEEWSRKIISQLESDISAGAITVKIWKNKLQRK
ncbi:MAG: hydrolase [Bacteroidetes bacterium]|nr:hydrolase [Bacteroidota bacterium]